MLPLPIKPYCVSTLGNATNLGDGWDVGIHTCVLFPLPLEACVCVHDKTPDLFHGTCCKAAAVLVCHVSDDRLGGLDVHHLLQGDLHHLLRGETSSIADTQ